MNTIKLTDQELKSLLEGLSVASTLLEGYDDRESRKYLQILEVVQEQKNG